MNLNHAEHGALLVLALTLAAAGTVSAVVNTNNPKARSPRSTFGRAVCEQFDDGLLHGHTLESPLIMPDFRSIHLGRFSDGTNLSEPPQVGPVTLEVVKTWLKGEKSFGDQRPQKCYTSKRFRQAVLSASKYARGEKLGGLNGGTIEDALKLLKHVIADVDVEISDAEKLGSLYEPSSARWLWQYDDGRTDRTYADPHVMSNLRLRGARLYCAAREAQHHQDRSTVSMGRATAFTIRLFGEPIDFLSVEPTFVLDGPRPFLNGARQPGCPVERVDGKKGKCNRHAPPDGGQAFVVPMKFGARITPVSFLPSLGEIRYPVVMLSGDSEITRAAGYEEGMTFKAVNHLDAVLSSEKRASIDSRFLMFTIGPMPVYADFGMGLALGQLYSTEDAQSCVDGGGAALTPGRMSPDNDRLLLQTAVGPEWPGQRTGLISWHDPPYPLWPEASEFDDYVYRDGGWAFPFVDDGMSADTSFPKPYFVWQEPSVHFGEPMYADNPMLLRALTDDDRHLRYSTSMGIAAGISGDADVNYFPLNVRLTVGGRICGSVSLRHTLRDAVTVQSKISEPGPDPIPTDERPISAVSIVPSMRSVADLGLFARLNIAIDLGFLGPWTIVDAELVKLIGGSNTQQLANWESGPWSERHRVRIGTGSSWGSDPMKQPLVDSHLPNSTHFPSFREDVDTCLENGDPMAPPPGRCSGTPATTTPPHSNVCLYQGVLKREGGLPTDVCGDLATFLAELGVTPEQAQCLFAQYALLCESTSKQQFVRLDGQPWHVVAHVLMDQNGVSAEDGQMLKSVYETCVPAGVPGGWDAPRDVIESYMQDLFGVALCDDSGALIPPDRAVESGSNPEEPPEVTAGSCRLE